MNNAPETMSQPFTSTSCAKSGRKLLQVLEHRPEQSFSQHSVATLIGMGKVVATRSSSSAQSRKRTAVQSQRVTDVVKADSVGQLREKHADDMTPCAEGSRHGIHPGLACEFRNKMRRNEIAKLPKNAEFGCGWFGVSFFHLCRVTELKNHSNHFFLCFNQDFYGTGVIFQGPAVGLLVVGVMFFICLMLVLSRLGVDWIPTIVISALPLAAITIFVQFFVNGRPPSYALDLLALRSLSRQSEALEPVVNRKKDRLKSF